MAGLLSIKDWGKVWIYRETFLLGFANTLKTAFGGLVLALVLGILFGLLSTSHKKSCVRLPVCT